MDPESFVRGGLNLTTFIIIIIIFVFVNGGPNLMFFLCVFFLFFFLGGGGLVDEGREAPNTTISRPSSARQRNASLDYEVT